MECNDSDTGEKRNSNTEYIPTKCRITKPPPPKPASNPLQFVKVAPCPLFQKAQEQIKKVEEIKRERKEIREEAEDWQQNLDNWKSSRRKRQEHIIERVVEVKKLEQEEHDRHRRKSKTFNEMMEDRSRGRHKFNIHIYEDDSNDLSDYGIGSSSSKTNSIKDVDTDDSSSILDEKDHRSLESPCNKDNSSASNQSQSEDETAVTKKDTITIQTNTIYTTKSSSDDNYIEKTETVTEQYTYEGAIQDYRTRIRSKIHVDESIFTRNQDYNTPSNKSKEFSEAQTAIPKGELCKRKELFEVEKPIEVNNYESHTTRRLSEDFVNTQSIKQRLQSLEKCAEQAIKAVDRGDISLVKQRLQAFNRQNSDDNKNNNNNTNNINNINKGSPPKISTYLMEKSNGNLSVDSKVDDWKKKEIPERCSSPETDLYMDKLNTFNKDLDTLMYGRNGGVTNALEECCVNQNYPPSTSSTELTGLSSDREDSGIHTADVSCSVSQADEPVEDLASTTIPSCIEKLTIEETVQDSFSTPEPEPELKIVTEVLETTKLLLDSLRKDSSENLEASLDKIDNNNIEETETNTTLSALNEIKEPIIYENIDIFDKTPVDFIGDAFVIDDAAAAAAFSLAPPTAREPPKVKPPPPPPPTDDEPEPPIDGMKRLNSTKRIKREIHIKRSSFLGLEEPTDEQIYPQINVDKPPDINTFLQKESKLEKSLYKKAQAENRIGLLSKVESHDSGLDIDRGRLSSDTWCSSIGDSSTPSPERQDSEPTNSITSEEDEITKKEREIIEMVEKEEKSRDVVEYEQNPVIVRNKQNTLLNNEPYLGSDTFKNPYFPQSSPSFLDDQDSEVLKVEHELRQLEREELERQRDNRLFEESRAKARLQNNRHSLENIFDEVYSYQQDGVNYRKSMPELQQVPLEYRKSLPDVPNAYSAYKGGADLDLHYRKSMPDIQHAYHKSIPGYRRPTENDQQSPQQQQQQPSQRLPVDHRKSMPELQQQRTPLKSPPPVKRQPIMPGKPLRPISKEQKDRFLLMNPSMSDALQHSNKHRQLSRHSLQALSAIPKNRHLSVDNWIQPRANPETKSYNQHWLYQEAELRRIAEQNRNMRPRQEKHLPEAVIQSLTQRVQNRAELNERNQAIRRSEGSPSKEGVQHPYLGHNQTMGHALPMAYPPQMALEESQDRMLSVSGKKKCSYCSNELGRGAAMIIESLCLFYHMECFKCCVCHMQLGDGLMGTDVRVRNEKLHCHNCYSSDDGIKFSCV